VWVRLAAVALLAVTAARARADFLLTTANDLNNTSTNNVSRYDLPAPAPTAGWFHTDTTPIAHPLALTLAADQVHAFLATGTGPTDGAIRILDVHNLANNSAFSTTTGFGQIFGMAVSPADGRLYAADYDNNRILRFDSNGVGSVFLADANLVKPTGLAFSADGSTLYVGNNSSNGNPGNAYIDSYNTATLARTPFATGLSGSVALSFAPGGRYLYAATGPAVGQTPTSDRILWYDTTLANPTANTFANNGFDARVLAMAWESPTSLFSAEYTADVNTSRITHYTVANNAVSGPVVSYHEGNYTNGLVGLTLVPTAAAVPEPCGLVLGAVGALAGALAYARRRRQAGAPTVGG
jgi:DNA-binding beta-propeller fold protein YncE